MASILKRHFSKSQNSPEPTSRDPTVPSFSSADPLKPTRIERIDVDRQPDVSLKDRCCTFIYNREENTFCGRKCWSWLYITVYSIVYMVFLCTFTMILLYVALACIRATVNFQSGEATNLLTYSEYGIGLTATPTSVSRQPIIRYRKDQAKDYQKYVNALDNLLVKKRRKRDAALGPCGGSPYGYGDTPCVILRINKHLHWSGNPLEINSTEAKAAPLEVQNWLRKDRKLWFHCSGYHSYDKEHIGRIKYFPDPPGIDPDVFPLGMESDSPLVAMQMLNFTLGVSLSIECKLWYVNGPSSVEFMLYVALDDKTVSSRFYNA